MDTRSLVNLIYEALVVKRMHRTGWQVLGDNAEELGGHMFMTAVIAYFLGKSMGANLEKVLTMSIFHDFHEARTGELDKINIRYVKRDEGRANRDIFGSTDPGLLTTIEEYERKESTEARIVYEANILALIVESKAVQERGNVNAGEWVTGNTARLRLPEAIALAEGIRSSNTQDWWKEIRDALSREYKQA